MEKSFKPSHGEVALTLHANVKCDVCYSFINASFHGVCVVTSFGDAV